MAQVINIRDAPNNWQSNPLYVSLIDNKWSSPYTFGVDAVTKDEMLSLYLAWLRAQITANSSFPHRVRGLCGKVLVCTCSPAPCHGDFLAYLADGLGCYEYSKGRVPEEFFDVGIFHDQGRILHLHQLVQDIALRYGRRIRGDMRKLAERAAKDMLGDGKADYSKWKVFRMKWLTPLLRWELPGYKKPIGEVN